MNQMDFLYLAHYDNIIDDEEFLLLIDMQKPKNLHLPYWNYERFDLNNLAEDECISEFRFEKEDIINLKNIMEIPDRVICYNGTNVCGIEAFCIFLKRYPYPCRYLDMIPRFGRPVPELCIINNHVLNFVYDRWSFLLRDMNQPWLSQQNLQIFYDTMHDYDAPLDNCWGFIDGTVRPICRPGENQPIVYNGHKRVHSIKFQSVVAPNGLIANLYGPVEGRRHDSGMLGDSGLLGKLQQHSFGPMNNILCIYGDPAYPLRPRLMAPFRGAAITPIETEWNKRMRKVRVSVEWIFGDIVNYFKFLDFKKGLKLQLSPVAKMYIVCALMHNARTCLYGKHHIKILWIATNSAA